MEKQNFHENKRPVTVRNEYGSPAFMIMVVMLMAVIAASAVVLIRYRPSTGAPKPKITLEEKIAYLENGTPLPGQESKPEVPRWMLAMILGFVVVQILPLVAASYKARAPELTLREVRQIEFLAETPLHLGLLGSLLGVCMTHFLSGSLSAPLAYLTTISGILLYLFGRFSILVTLPSTNDYT